MKIILDFRKYDGVVGGVEQGAMQIAHNASGKGHEVVLVCKKRNLSGVAELMGERDGIKIVPVPARSHAISLSNAWADGFFFSRLASREKADVVHFFYNWSFPFVKSAPCLLTVHDVIPFTCREAMALLRNRILYRPAMRRACALNDMIATVSEFSRQDISAKVGAPLNKIRVIYNGLRNPGGTDEEVARSLTKRFRLENGFVLNVGGIHERKNIPRLIRAFARVVERHGYRGNLVITGKTAGAPYQDKMKKICDAELDACRMHDRVVFTEFVSNEELDTLLRRADVLVYPSLYEGFGIPVLEAMKVGTPVIASNTTALPEVAGGAAILVDPLDEARMGEEILRVIEDKALRQKLSEKGLKRAEGFSWARNCDEYLELYREISTSFGRRNSPGNS